MSKDNKQEVSSLIDEATKRITGGAIHWYQRLPIQAQPFIDTLSKRVAQEGIKANARTVSEILAVSYTHLTLPTTLCV